MRKLGLSSEINIKEEITLDTKAWENDYKVILSSEYLNKLSSLTTINPSQICVFINNVWLRGPVQKMARKALDEGLISRFVFVDEIAEEVLEHFALKKADFGFGYRYSICELAAIYLNNRPYTMHFSSDTLPTSKLDTEFYSSAIKLLGDSSDVSVVNVMWNENAEEHASQSIYDDSSFWYSAGGFSDQMYLVKTDEFRNQIYSFKHPESNRYPMHAHGLFEQRVDSYLRAKNKIRATYKHVSYRHLNHPVTLRSRVLRKVMPTSR